MDLNRGYIFVSCLDPLFPVNCDFYHRWAAPGRSEPHLSSSMPSGAGQPALFESENVVSQLSQLPSSTLICLLPTPLLLLAARANAHSFKSRYPNFKWVILHSLSSLEPLSGRRNSPIPLQRSTVQPLQCAALAARLDASDPSFEVGSWRHSISLPLDPVNPRTKKKVVGWGRNHVVDNVKGGPQWATPTLPRRN